MAKRLFDIVLATLGLVLLSPLLALIVILIKLDSRGPVFYRGVRMGKGFKPFRIFKFRTMVVNAERLGGPSTRAGDPRLTNIGKFLRKLNLDELPQFLNILKGEMSLVGPRPEVPEYAKLYQGEEKLVYSIKPGWVDYATLWNFHEEEILTEAKNTEETERIYLEKIRPEKVRLQMKYVKEMSLWADIKIMLGLCKKLFTS